MEYKVISIYKFRNPGEKVKSDIATGAAGTAASRCPIKYRRGADAKACTPLQESHFKTELTWTWIDIGNCVSKQFWSTLDQL